MLDKNPFVFQLHEKKACEELGIDSFSEFGHGDIIFQNRIILSLNGKIQGNTDSVFLGSVEFTLTVRKPGGIEIS